jgi:transglutaminase/protease-like cytokinesis protein 3
MNHAWNLVIFSDGTQAWVDTCWNDARYQFSDGRVVETSVQNGIPAEDVKKLRSRYLLIDTDTLLNDHVL